jgi:hypothetical protein
MLGFARLTILLECDRSFTRSDALAKHMRTVHETEALRPSDPVPKHHSSNPSNKFQRLRLVLSHEARKQEKGSTPASPSSHAPHSATAPISADVEHSHNNVIYLQDGASPNAPTIVQFPEDLTFTDRELTLPAPDLYSLLRRQLHWATQEGEKLRAEVDVLEKKRKHEWLAKELIVENVMEAELSHTKRKRIESGLLQEPESFGLLDEDIAASKVLKVEPKAGRSPWWREDNWLTKLVEAQLAEETKEAEDAPLPEPLQDEMESEEPLTQEAA